MKKLHQALFAACLFTMNNELSTGIDVTLNPADPNPLNNSKMPIDYIYEHAKEAFRNGQFNSGAGVQITALPFHQHAKQGTDVFGYKSAELGDLGGNANLFAIMNSPKPLAYNANSAIPKLLGTSASLDTVPDNTVVPPVVNDGKLPNNLLLDLQAANYTNLSGVITGTEQGLIYGGTAFTGSGTTGLPTSAPTPTQFTTMAGLQSLQDQFSEIIGYLTIPAKYSKFGSRFEITGATNWGFGASVRIGIASINQSGTFDNKILFGPVSSTTPTGTYTPPAVPPVTTTVTPNQAYYLVNGVQVLVNNPFYNDATFGKVTDAQWFEALKVIKQDTAAHIEQIARATGINLNDFQKTGVEDLKLELFWRKGLRLNTEQPVVFVPYVSLVGSLDVAGPVDPNQILATPFGNNGHKSYGGNAGCTLDFDNSFEIGTAVGIINFNSRIEPNMRIPNQVEQNVIYPYSTSARITPGSTWFASLIMNSYHFEENLTFFMQYIYIGHGQDKIVLTEKTIDSVFIPSVLENKTGWNSQMANIGLTYEVSPSVTIGCCGQIPLKQLNAYRSATFAVSISASH